MNARTQIVEPKLIQASPNIDTYPMLCAIEDCTQSGVVSAIQNSSPIANWSEYNEASKVLTA